MIGHYVLQAPCHIMNQAHTTSSIHHALGGPQVHLTRLLALLPRAEAVGPDIRSAWAGTAFVCTIARALPTTSARTTGYARSRCASIPNHLRTPTPCYSTGWASSRGPNAQRAVTRVDTILLQSMHERYNGTTVECDTSSRADKLEMYD